MGSLASERTVVGWAARDATGHLSPYTYTVRKTGPEDVVVKVLYCGICHTDIHQAKNQLGASKYPMVPGHEVVGEVVEVGPEVSRHRVGDIVGVGVIVGCCRECRPCKANVEQYCNKRIWSYNDVYTDGRPTQGGFASTMIVDQKFVVKIPAGLAPEQAAPLLCAGVTVYSPLKHFGLTTPGLRPSLLLEEGNSAETGPGVQAKTTVSRLESIREILDIIFRGGGQDHAKYYRFHVNEFQQTSGDALKVLGKSSRTLSWWCFNPGLAMEEFLKLGVRSIILTSGTLSPLDSLAMELNLEFPVRLENPHVISPDQIWVGVVPVGPSGHALNSSYRTRETIQYKQELGNAIVNFARIVPDGLLVFFPSYSMMDKCIEFWKNRNHSSSAAENTIWQRICKHKQPVIEPRQSSNFPNAIEDYAAKLNDSSTSGAIFFAVCRGKVCSFSP